MKKLLLSILLLLLCISVVYAKPPITIVIDQKDTNDLITVIDQAQGEKVKLILENELAKYKESVLDALNINFYIGKLIDSTMAGWAQLHPNKCLVYLSGTDETKQQITKTIHHEIYHCYDKNTTAWNFTISDRVQKGWSYSTTAVFSREERAEYFAATVLNNYWLFNGNNSVYAADPQMNQKIVAILPDVQKLMKPETRQMTWIDGKISEITSTRFDGLVTSKINFNHDALQYTIFNGYTNESQILPQ